MSQTLNRQQRRAQARKLAKAHRRPVTPIRPMPAADPEPITDDPWLAQPAANRALIQSLDGYAGLRNGLRKIGQEREEWAGVPLPMDGMPMTIEPTYPDAEKLMAIGVPKRSAEDDDIDEQYKDITIRNRWFSVREQANVVVYEKNGRIESGVMRPTHPLKRIMDTVLAADAWGIEQEARAVHKLGELLRHRQFKQYMLTGTFVEKSKRSGVHYLFRRLRPTIAFSMATGTAKCLAALCLHPIGYYQGTWAGAMVPTDDVIAHLMLMRGDEHMFWRRSNQHRAYHPDAGIF